MISVLIKDDTSDLGCVCCKNLFSPYPRVLWELSSEVLLVAAGVDLSKRGDLPSAGAEPFPDVTSVCDMIIQVE